MSETPRGCYITLVFPEIRRDAFLGVDDEDDDPGLGHLHPQPDGERGRLAVGEVLLVVVLRVRGPAQAHRHPKRISPVPATTRQTLGSIWWDPRMEHGEIVSRVLLLLLLSVLLVLVFPGVLSLAHALLTPS